MISEEDKLYNTRYQLLADFASIYPDSATDYTIEFIDGSIRLYLKLTKYR